MTEQSSPRYSIPRGGLAVSLALAAFACAVIGLIVLNAGSGHDPLSRYLPQQEGAAARYRVTYPGGQTGWLSTNLVHADENLGARVLLLDALPIQQDSLWLNAGGEIGRTERRSDVYGRSGDFLAQTALRIGPLPLNFQPPLLILSIPFLQGQTPISGQTQLADGTTIALTRTLAGVETITTPAGVFVEALKLHDDLRIGEQRQQITTWLALDQGVVRSETVDSGGNRVELRELEQANFGPAAGRRASLPLDLPRPETGHPTHSGQNAARTHTAPYPKPITRLPLQWLHQNRNAIGGSPIGSNGLIAAIDQAGVLTVQDALSGAVHWRFSTGAAAGSSPALARGILTITGGDKRLHALDASTGLFLWSFTSGDAITASPLIADDRVFIASGDRSLYALDANSGQLLWERRMSDALTASPALLDDTLLAVDNSGLILALAPATGDVRWEAAAGAGVSAMPALDRGQAFVAARDFILYAFDQGDGRAQWTFETRGQVLGGLAVDARSVYLADDAGWAYAVDRLTGEQRWAAAMPDGYAVGAPLLLGETLIIATEEGYVVALDPASGEVRASFYAADESFTSTPWWDASSERLVLTGVSGAVYSFDPAVTDAVPPPLFDARWEADVRLVQGQPVAGHDGVYLLNSEGNLLAFDRDSGQGRAISQNLGPLLRVSPQLSEDEDRAFVATLNGEALAVDLESGETLWRSRAGQRVQFSPSLDRDNLFVEGLTGEDEGLVICLNAADGTLKWQTRLAGPGSAAPLIWRDRVVAAAGEVASLDRETGRIVWRAEVGPVSGALGVGPDGTVYAGSEHGWTALDGETGDLRWQRSFAVPPGPWPPAVDEAHQVLVLALADGLHGLDPDSGEPLWHFPTEWPALNGVVVRDGLAYAAIDNGQLIALDSGNGRLRSMFWPGGTSVGAEGPPAFDGDRLYFVQGLTLYGLEVGP